MGLKLSEIKDPKLLLKIRELDQQQNPRRLGAVAPRVPERPPLRPLDKVVQKRQTRKGGVAIIITLVTCRSRECDDDGNVAACKPLRDAISATLGLDDGDARIRWEYGQSETHGAKGVLVKIERL